MQKSVERFLLNYDQSVLFFIFGSIKKKSRRKNLDRNDLSLAYLSVTSSAITQGSKIKLKEISVVTIGEKEIERFSLVNTKIWW